ncbi:MAG TPA: hypothetical protein PKE57_01075 [Cellvibrionaceae bacterium]|nr:hypothetical protein [Cellvibrionaceae bacterium]HMW46732.1 hypothetical protein [Cellvibrionaceae bacterium]HMW72325.1 hypothetical protein [Cellvibrionaceae bacterium]HMY39270.1 hypothetical protein [Marinagarivorans sp.]HNG58314.1 hypothetical protein [Cellvibrionaceae bacterium]
MEMEELQKLGEWLCRSLLARDFETIAKNLGYALAGEIPAVDAIKNDFDSALKESGGALECLRYDVAIKPFASGTPGFFNLIECRFAFSNANQEILAEIIENERGCYLEQISCV